MGSSAIRTRREAGRPVHRSGIRDVRRGGRTGFAHPWNARGGRWSREPRASAGVEAERATEKGFPC